VTQTEKHTEEIADLRRAIADQKLLLAKIIHALRTMPSTLPNQGDLN
jgi:hypothetical protein